MNGALAITLYALAHGCLSSELEPQDIATALSNYDAIAPSISYGGGDWAEVRVGEVVVFRGHHDEANEYLIDMMGIKVSYDDVDGPRVRPNDRLLQEATARIAAKLA